MHFHRVALDLRPLFPIELEFSSVDLACNVVFFFFLQDELGEKIIKLYLLESVLLTAILNLFNPYIGSGRENSGLNLFSARRENL